MRCLCNYCGQPYDIKNHRCQNCGATVDVSFVGDVHPFALPLALGEEKAKIIAAMVNVGYQFQPHQFDAISALMMIPFPKEVTQ